MKHKRNINLGLASAMALGTVVAVAPVATQASVNFSDVKETNQYYNAVVSLAERGIIKGFEDGTFKPGQSVTRGQAAKIIAGVLKLDTTNVVDPGFKDVPTTHQYYGAIAALANAGIINGYPDGTYGPGKDVQRNHMAKIISGGFKLEAPAGSTTPFEDISSEYAGYITALYDAGITTGKTSTTFDGSSDVTRGQLAAFVVRAEDATPPNDATGGQVTPPVIDVTAVTVETAAQLIETLADSTVQFIKLGADIEVDDILTITRDVTIYGENHKITRSVSEATDSESYAVMVSSGKLTAKNLKLESINTQSQPIANAVGITVQSGASLDFDGGTITASSENRSAYGVYAQNGATAVSVTNTKFELTAVPENRYEIAMGLETADKDNANPFGILTNEGNTIGEGTYELYLYVPADFVGDPIALLEEAVTDGQKYLYTGAKIIETVETATQLMEALADSTVEFIKLGADIEVAENLNVTRDVTIYGGNHKITRSVSESTDSESYAVMVSSGKLTAKNLKLESINTQSQPIANAVGITVQSGASLDFDGGTITASSENRSAYGVYAQNGATAVNVTNTKFELTAVPENRYEIAMGLETADKDNANPLDILTNKGNTISTGAFELYLYVPADFVGDPIALLEEAVTDGQKYLYLGAKTVVDEAKADDNVEVSAQTLSLGTDFILENGVIKFI